MPAHVPRLLHGEHRHALGLGGGTGLLGLLGGRGEPLTLLGGG